MCAAAAALMLGLGTGGQAKAQTVYDGSLSSSEQAEVVAWSTLFWQRVDQGGGSPGTGFAFTNSAMNSALFNPLRGVRSTLEKVGSILASDCDEMASVQASTEATAIRAKFRAAMLEGKIETDVQANVYGTIQHANLILASPSSAGLTVYVAGTSLVSLNLPLEKVSATAYQASLAMNLSTQSQSIIAAMIASGATWASNAGTVSESQKHITGQASRADNFAATVRGMLDAVGVANSSAAVITAQFGVYGALPVVAVQLGDAMVLLDPLNGNMSGPFTPTSALDATGLLSNYSSIYVAGTSVAYYTASGCPTFAAPSWKTRPPNSPWWPQAPAAPWPVTPGVPGPPAVAPGGGGSYTCGVTTGGVCRCIRTDTRTPPAGVTPVPTQNVCDHTAGCGPAGGSCPTGPQPPNPATGDTPTPAACPAPICHAEYFY